ncbi:MAG: 30S ribosomal protein S6 [Gaiellales bacterium]
MLVMFDADFSEDEQTDVVARAQEIVERGDGTWLNTDTWGRRKLAYEIDHKGEAYYHLLTFDCPPATLDELSRVLRITEGIVRHLAVRRIPQAGVPADAEPEAASA